MRKTLLLVLLVGMCLYAGAQTYIFDNAGGAGDGNWNTATNWNPVGVPPNPLPAPATIEIAANCNQNVGRTIESGASLVINVGFTLTRNNVLTIQGDLTVTGMMINNRTLAISATGTLTNNGIINHGDTGGDNINNLGTIENNGEINVLFGNLRNQSTGIFNNNAGGTINVSTGAVLLNQNQMNNAGDIVNYGTFTAANGDVDVLTNTATGTITNYGTLTLHRTLQNDGDISNYGTLNIANNALANLNNNATGTITNNASGTINNNNILNNAGMFVNDGILNAATGNNDLFNNTGTLINNLTLTVSNGGYLINALTGELTNNSSATLTIANNGNLTNDGLLNNNGLINNNNNLINTGTLNNNTGATINNGNNPGDLLFNTGTLNNNTGATINNNPGAIVDTNNGIFINNGTYTGNAPLPIELVSFIGKPAGNVIELRWETASEKDNAYMAVEHSRDGVHFREIGRRKGAGTTSLPQYYNFTDPTPFAGVNYYRLRQVDLDEKVSYHFIISILFDGKTTAGIQLFPTQTNHEITIVLPTLPAEGSMLQILDVNGRLVQQQVVNQENTQERINVSALPAGTYFVTIQMGSTRQTGRFIKL